MPVHFFMLVRAGIRALCVGAFAAGFFIPASVPTAKAQQVSIPVQAYGLLHRRAEYLWGLANPYIQNKADFFGGIDAAKATTFVWMGATYAPFGTLGDDGWRVRVIGGAGKYSHNTSVAPGGINDAFAFSGELLGGYRKAFADVLGHTIYAGVFAGLHYEDQILVYDDPGNPARGSDAGFKASLELYSRVRQHFIVTAFGSVSTVHEKYYAKTSLLYELNETWSLGGEIAAMGDARHKEQRAGLAGSLSWQKKIFTLSAGMLDNSERGDGTYLTLSVYSPF